MSHPTHLRTKIPLPTYRAPRAPKPSLIRRTATAINHLFLKFMYHVGKLIYSEKEMNVQFHPGKPLKMPNNIPAIVDDKDSTAEYRPNYQILF